MQEQQPPNLLIAGDHENTSQFYIPATTSLQERRLRALKHGDTFALFNHYGDIVPFLGAPDGLYHRDTRYLSLLELRLNGQRPLLLSSTVHDDNAVCDVDLTNADIVIDGELVLPRETIHLQRSKFIWQGVCHERISVRSYDSSSLAIMLTIRFGSDFADLFEVRGQKRERRGLTTCERISDQAAALTYVGLDDVARTTTVHFTPKPRTLDASSAYYELTLEPQGQFKLFLAIACSAEGDAVRTDIAYHQSINAARRALDTASARATRIGGSNSRFNHLLSRSLSDLYMLITDTPHGPYPYAGIPWFSTAFGRDGLLTALFTLWIDPAIAAGVLRYLAATQAGAEDPARDAEPGKMLHETRAGEMAVLREVPFGLYYGSVDTTPLYVILADAYVRGSIATATPMATASSSTTAIPRLASSIRAGRIRTIRYSTLMEAWRLVQSRCARSRPMFIWPNAERRRWRVYSTFPIRH